MIDARNIYRKVTRKIYDFSPEQQANLAAIVWLYRGQKQRFLNLVKDYFQAVCRECEIIPTAVGAFDETTAATLKLLTEFETAMAAIKGLDADRVKAFRDALAELQETRQAYDGDRLQVIHEIAAFRKGPCKSLPATNDKQHAARKAFEPIAERIKGLVKQIDLLYKLAVRVADAAVELAANEDAAEHLDRRGLTRQLKDLDPKRHEAVDQLKQAVYFHRQIVWLQERFPDAQFQSVPGLVKVADYAEIEAADWCLTPGRYVGVAPAEADEDFDFEQALRDIHIELASLNEDAIQLAGTIQANFEELGI
jgi:type I restriction enzyme M protein